MDETLDDKQYIEKLLQKYAKSKLGNEDALYRLYTVVRRSISGRVAYEVLGRYENGQDIISDYGFQKKFSDGGGIPLSLEKISNDVWVPESYKKLVAKSKNHETFEIFNQDELNAFIGFDSKMASSPIVQKVLYCKDENGRYLGKKMDLFLNDAEWRNDAKTYSRLLIEHMRKNYADPKEVAQMDVGDDFKRFVESLKGISRVTSLYLNEMK